MKTDRFSSASVRAAAVLLVGFLLAASLPTAGGAILQGSVRVTYEMSPERLAQEVAFQVGEVQKRFDENRLALRPVKDSNRKPAYLRQDVAGLVTRTGEDLDQALERVGEPGLDALRAWVAEELGRIQGELAPPAGRKAASFPGLSTPRPVAVVASLGGLPLLAGSKPAPPKQDTVPAEKADSLLNQVGEVVSRIFFLADRKDLEVDLWVGNTPETKATFTFSFWPQGKIKGATRETATIRSNSKPTRVLRGLYSYKAALGSGRVTEFIQYPVPTGAPDGRPSDRLDLVKRSGFFCCWFKDKYCSHVEDETECHP